MTILSWSISVLVVVLLLTFLWSLVSLRAIPLGARPRTRTYDRFGAFIAMAENPDYHENPAEQEAKDDDTPDVRVGGATDDVRVTRGESV